MRIVTFSLVSLMLFVNSIFADTDPRAKKICMEYTKQDERVKCLVNIRDITFDNAVFDICPSYTYVKEKHQCLLNLGNAEYSPFSTRICITHPHANQKEKCQEKFKDSYVHKDAYGICSEYSHAEKQENCLVNLMNLTFEKDVLVTCNAYPHTAKKEACMRDLGTPYDNGYDGFIGDTIISKINHTLSAIENADYEKAKTFLEKLKKFVNEHEGEPL